MKRIMTYAMALAASGIFCSCNNASELPPIDEGYATTFVLPEPENLTQEERTYIEQLEAEYEAAIKQ